MTSSRDTDRILDRWMDEGPRAVADRVMAGAMTEVQTTRQRTARWVALKEIFRTLKPAAAVVGLAAVIIFGIAAYQYVSGGGQRAGDLAESPHVRASPEPAPSAPDLADIVVTNDNAPEGWAVEWTLRGREALAYLIRYGQESNATPGFIDARATEICSSIGLGCGISWGAVYESEADAEAAFDLFHAEMQVGWGLGDRAQSIGLGEDEGHDYGNNLGNAPANHAKLWRKGTLLLGVIGLAELETVAELESDELRPVAEEMNSRSR